MRAHRAQIAGDNDEGHGEGDEALHIGTDSGQPDAAAFFNVQLGTINAQRGMVGDNGPLLEQLRAQLPLHHESITAALAIDYVEAGRLDDARRLLEEFAATDYRLRPHPGSWLSTWSPARTLPSPATTP
ncbi:MAG: hypothetical protein WKF58_16015 [Ilumatobacteraceae bacterium]